MGLTAHRRAAQRLTTGGATLTRRAAQWAARNRLTAAATLTIGAPTALNALHRTPELAAAAAAGWLWAAWRATPPPDHIPTDTPTAPTSDDRGQKGQHPPAGEGLSIIKTVNGTARTYADPNRPDHTEIRWDKP